MICRRPSDQVCGMTIDRRNVLRSTCIRLASEAPPIARAKGAGSRPAGTRAEFDPFRLIVEQSLSQAKGEPRSGRPENRAGRADFPGLKSASSNSRMRPLAGDVQFTPRRNGSFVMPARRWGFGRVACLHDFCGIFCPPARHPCALGGFLGRLDPPAFPTTARINSVKNKVRRALYSMVSMTVSGSARSSPRMERTGTAIVSGFRSLEPHFARNPRFCRVLSLRKRFWRA